MEPIGFARAAGAQERPNPVVPHLTDTHFAGPRGENVVDLDPVLGYLHRGVEKIVENGDWHHAISNCDPLEYIASMFSEAIPVQRGAGHVNERWPTNRTNLFSLHDYVRLYPFRHVMWHNRDID